MQKYTDLSHFFGAKLSISGNLVNNETEGKPTHKSNVHTVRRNSTMTRHDSFDLELNQLAQVHVIAQGFLCL